MGRIPKKFRFKKIDAFTNGQSGGNPAGCIYLNSIFDISNDEMQRIASQLKGFVNEMVYLFPEKDSYFLKYYSSECEVEFCGHGTIAVMYDLIKNNDVLLNKPELKIRVKDEILIVKNNILVDDSVYIYAPSPVYGRQGLSTADISKALGIDEGPISLRYPVGLVNGGLNTLIVPVESLKACLSILPDQEALRQFCINNGIDIILVFTAETAYKENNYRTRVFAPKFGYLEDPATGSGNSAFGYYLMKEMLWDGDKLSIEQSGDKFNPNVIKLGSAELNDRRHVIFGGSAIARIDGEYILY